MRQLMHNQYQTNMIMNSAPHIQIAMLLSKASQHIEDAIALAEKKDFMGRYEKAEKASAILHALSGLLSNSDHPEMKLMVKTLSNYYQWAIITIATFNVKNDIKLGLSLQTSLREVATTWRNLSIKPQTKSTAPQTSDNTNPISLMG